MKKNVHRQRKEGFSLRRLATMMAMGLVSPFAEASAGEPPPTNPPAQTDAVLASPAGAAASKPALDLAQVAETPALWPKEVTLLKPVSFPVVFAGRVAGQTLVPAGSHVRLIRVVSSQAEVENFGARQLIAANLTDLLARATRLWNPAPAVHLASDPPPRSTSPPTNPPTPTPPGGPGTPEAAIDYGARAREVAAEIQRDFWNPQTGLYAEKPGAKDPAVVWSGGVMFSALVGAARNDPDHYEPVMKKFFDGLDRYWDRQEAIPGYEPLPTNGRGDDKYYDDNEWLVIAFLEAHAVTGNAVYSQRAAATLKFVLSGWDETYLKGGIWWHQTHEKKVRAKNTCANAPAAVACLQTAKISQPEEASRLIGMAEKIVDWTVTNLQAPDGLFVDTRDIEGDGMNKAQLTYNSALMVRAFLGLYHATGKPLFLQQAQRIALAADALLDKKTGVYRDPVKWAHLMVEADLALYRTTKEPYLLQRARKQADAYYDRWKAKGPVDLITVASISRVLWLMADMETEAGRNFWIKEDAWNPETVPAGVRSTLR